MRDLLLAALAFMFSGVWPFSACVVAVCVATECVATIVRACRTQHDTSQWRAAIRALRDEMNGHLASMRDEFELEQAAAAETTRHRRAR